MKNKSILMAATILLGLFSCDDSKKRDDKHKGDEEKEISYDYSLKISAMSDETTSSLPALQSFVLGSYNGEWLMFSGRTNEGNTDNGGLHNQDSISNYATNSFPPSSYNTSIFVYNPTSGKTSSITYEDLLSQVKNRMDEEEENNSRTALYNALNASRETFRASNPQVYQDGEDLYIIGGYGTSTAKDTAVADYKTFNRLTKINIPAWIKLIKGETLNNNEWKNLLYTGTNETLTATGGELHKIGDDFYLAGGHNYFNPTNDSSVQIYLNAVYKFNVSTNANDYSIMAEVTDTITDVPLDSITNLKWMDSTSHFRRRDGPIVPCLYATKSGKLKKGINFYAGVFLYSFGAWNDAIHITPELSNQYFTDSSYNQNNYNVYSCPDVGVFDSNSEEVHTFLPGGIGNGGNDGNLSAFTNTMGHAIYYPQTKASSFSFEQNTFPDTNFYGAEAEFILNQDVPVYKLNGNSTDLIDAKKLFSGAEAQSTMSIGHIYGGIVSFVPSPGRFGPKLSGASNKVWKVELVRTEKTKNTKEN